MMTSIEQSLADYLGGYTRNNPANRAHIVNYQDWQRMARLFIVTRLVIKCPRCRALNVLKAESLPPERRRASSIERMPDGRLQESEGAGPLR